MRSLMHLGHLGLLGICALVSCKEAERYKERSQRTEAAVQLNKLGKNLKATFVANDQFPVGKTGPKPAVDCCKGQNAKCPVETDWAKDPVWASLDFTIDDPNRFRYSYQSDGKSATATAIGDLDCDGDFITYKLEVVSQGGNPVATITEPDPNAD